MKIDQLWIRTTDVQYVTKVTQPELCLYIKYQSLLIIRKVHQSNAYIKEMNGTLQHHSFEQS